MKKANNKFRASALCQALCWCFMWIMSFDLILPTILGSIIILILQIRRLRLRDNLFGGHVTCQLENLESNPDLCNSRNRTYNHYAVRPSVVFGISPKNKTMCSTVVCPPSSKFPTSHSLCFSLVPLFSIACFSV